MKNIFLSAAIISILTTSSFAQNAKPKAAPAPVLIKTNKNSPKPATVTIKNNAKPMEKVGIVEPANPRPTNYPKPHTGNSHGENIPLR